MFNPVLLCLLWVFWSLSLVLMLLCAMPLLFPGVWVRLFSASTVPMSQKPAAPSPAPDPTPAPASAPAPALAPAPTPEPAEPANPWETFCAQPLEPVLEQPFPEFAVAAAPPAEEELTELMASGRMLELLTRCADTAHQVAVAERFQAWCEGKPSGDSLLLPAEEGVDYWVAGDVHGAFCTLLQVWAFVTEQARKTGRKGCLVLLGDVIDRGQDDLPCLALIEELMMSGGQDGVRLLCLRGNHDAALWQDPRGNFCSYVLPAETMERLNTLRANGPAGAAESIGRAAIELARISPCMAELTQLAADKPAASVLLTHGGVPHVDLQEQAVAQAADYPELVDKPLFDSLPESARGKWAEDFTWIRLVDRLPHKRPNRGSHGNEMGTRDVNTYRRLHLRLTGRAIGFIIRGHDHEPRGYRLYSYDAAHNPARGSFVQKNCGILTINTMEHSGVNPLFRQACPALARLQRGGKLTLYPMPGAVSES